MTAHSWRLRWCLLAVLCTSVPGLYAYTFLSYHWSAKAAAGGITMHLQLGESGPLADGSASWGVVAEDVLAKWNSYLKNFQFKVVRDSTIPKRGNDGKNSVFFSDKALGEDFDDSTFAVATAWFVGGVRKESDVIFNANISWNSYRGPQSTVIDFKRVALHEFGHVLGLDHPDQAQQNVEAIMNSRSGDIDALRLDDIIGGQTLWGAAPPFFSLSATRQKVTASGGARSFNVTASGSWSWTKDGASVWVSTSEAETQNGDQTFIYTVAPNTSTTERTATITLTDGEITLYHVITQAVGTSVRIWGSNDYGQSTVPSNLGEVTAITAATFHTAVLKNNGTVAAWGANNLGSGSTVVPPNLSGVIAISANVFHTAALKSDGTVVAWGTNSEGEISIPTNLSGVVAIASGYKHMVALKNDGKVVGWGGNGRRGAPDDLWGVTDIAAGTDHTVALRFDGTVLCWGHQGNDYGQQDVPPSLGPVSAIAAGAHHTVALRTNGTVVAWGRNTDGQTNVPAGLKDVVSIAAGGAHTVALKADGKVVAWGRSNMGQTTVPSNLGNVISIAAGGLHTVALVGSEILTVSPERKTIAATGGEQRFSVTASGDWSWSRTGYGDWITCSEPSTQNGDQTFDFKVAENKSDLARLTTFVLTNGLFVRKYHVMQLGTTGVRNLAGRPDGEGTSEIETGVPLGLENVVQIVEGGNHTVALKKDGTVMAWGRGENLTSVPPNLSNVISLAAGRTHTLALKADGTVVAWGTGEQINVPGGLNSVVAIAAGGVHSVALKSDGTVVAWGLNYAGVTTVPSGLRGVVAIAAGVAFTVALRADGKVVAWGENRFGETSVPANLSGVIAIAAGGEFAVALKSNGTVVAWGHNGAGQTKVPRLSGVTKISAGMEHVVALKNDGTIVAWGDVTVPAGLKGVVDVAAGGDNVVGFIGPNRPGLIVTRQVPAAMASFPDKVGTATFQVTPSKSASAINRYPMEQSAFVYAGASVQVTAAPKAGYLFSHWIGVPTHAHVNGNVVKFTMPTYDVWYLTAVFVESPFPGLVGTKPAVFQGLLTPSEGTLARNSTVGLFSATLTPGPGSVSGKVLLDGLSTAFTALLHGDGSIWFKGPVGYTPGFYFLDREMKGTWSAGGLAITLRGTGTTVSTGVARTIKAPGSALLDSKGKSGYYTLALPSETQVPGKSLAEYPQGTGYSTFSLTNNGTLKLAGVLADGTNITNSTFLMEGDTSAVFVQLPTPGSNLKGGSFLGTLSFNPALSSSDVGGNNFLWFRPAVIESSKAATKPYTLGWPEGLTLDPVGAKFTPDVTVASSLALGEPNLSGNALLTFERGKLTADVPFRFNVSGSKVVKLDPKDKDFTLSVSATTGLFKGTFKPNWSTPAKAFPAFQGVILQKGGNKGGYGYFQSNSAGDNDPQSGIVTLEAVE